jgi:flotillin
MDTAQIVGIAVGLGAFAILLIIIFVKTNVVLCQPNELLILAGRQRREADGTKVGYRVIRGGRGFKMPFVESVARLPLTALPLDVRVGKAMCSGMIPVTVDGRANVKLAGRPEQGLDAAIERFLGKGPDAVIKSAQQAIEGSLRGVIGTVSPEEANAQRLDLADQVTERARDTLRQLGIVLDFFQIHDVSDEHGYLEAIGRKRNAEVKRDAQIAEATADAEARRVASEQKLTARTAEIGAESQIIAEENELEVKRARLSGEENQARQRAEVAAKIARTEEELQLYEKRIELSQKRHESDTVIPARAEREATQMRAEGKAARILEDGRATAQAVEQLRAQWPNEDTRELFLIQLLPTLLDKVTSVVSENLRVDKLTILDGGDGSGLPAYVKNLTNGAVTMLEQLSNATGVDLAKLAQGKNGGGAVVPKELDD